MAFTPFDPLPASDLNKIIANQQALAGGTGLDSNSVVTANIADGTIDEAQLATAASWWTEIGKTTLAASATAFSVTFVAKKFLYVKLKNIALGGTTSPEYRFNSDSANNYAYRLSTNGAADTTTVSTSFFLANINGGLTVPTETDSYIANFASSEKIGISYGLSQNTAGATNPPERRESVSKWANTSDQITRIDVFNLGGSGTFDVGSQITVLGHD